MLNIIGKQTAISKISKNSLLHDTSTKTIFHFPRALVLLYLVFLLMGCTCSDAVKNTVVSQRGEHRVSVVVRDCGATTDYSTLVMLRRPWWKGGDKTLVAYNGIIPIKAKWESGDKLLLVEPPGANHLKKAIPPWLTIKFSDKTGP